MGSMREKPNVKMSNIFVSFFASSFFGPKGSCGKHKAVASYSGFETFCRSLRGQYFIFGALCPSKSGLVNKHIVKHIVTR